MNYDYYFAEANMIEKIIMFISKYPKLSGYLAGFFSAGFLISVLLILIKIL